MERWPPVYDAKELAQQIRDLAGASDMESRFYTNSPDMILCQGDIFGLETAIPVIDEDGEAAAIDDCKYWMAIGNTCDFSRAKSDVEWTQLVPILDLGAESDISSAELQKLRSYQPFRTFYVPTWREEVSARILVADLTRPVAT